MYRFPDEVLVTDVADPSTSGANTPAGEGEDDFFSSWDKPTIKRPSNPPSRTGTPGIGRTASPFLAPNGSGTARPKSPLAGNDTTSETPATAPPAASRAISSSAIRKTGAAAAPRKANILGAKKTKLGAKKVDASALDFEAAEKKAREEAERIEKLGYDPDAGATPSESAIKAAQPIVAEPSKIVSPSPVNPGRTAGFGATEKNSGDVERLGMGVRKLGFGQVGGGAPASSKPKAMGFGSTSRGAAQGKIIYKGVTHAWADIFLPDDSEKYAREKFGAQKGISSDEFFGRASFDPSAQAEAKGRLQGFEGATSISSNAYFGRSEEEVPEGEYGDLETAAKDFVRKFGITAGDDLENLTNVLGEGATKLQGERCAIPPVMFCKLTRPRCTSKLSWLIVHTCPYSRIESILNLSLALSVGVFAATSYPESSSIGCPNRSNH